MLLSTQTKSTVFYRFLLYKKKAQKWPGHSKRLLRIAALLKRIDSGLFFAA